MSLPTSLVAQTITGKVFRDFNSNGILDNPSSHTGVASGEIGVPGIRVRGTSTAGTSVSVLTGIDGSYSLTGLTGAVRVEFSNLTAGDFDSFKGSGNGTSVQFVTAGATNVNYGINYPANYCQTVDPQLVTTCFVALNAVNSPLGDRDALVGVPYEGINTTAPISHYATVGDIGSAWGLAYKKDTKQLFSAAFTKRHVGFGKGGPNAIYITNLNQPTATSTEFFNFTTVGASAVTSTTEAHGDDIPTTLGSNNRLYSYDIPAFDAVGKTALGDIDISDDDKTLYVVNLKDRKLYLINIATKAYTSFAIPDPSCQGTGYRPFAVKYYRGKAYVGVVCTREDVTAPAAYTTTPGLKATVYEFDGTNFTDVLSFPLTYQKAATNADLSGQARAEYWRPWTATYQADRDGGFVSYPQAWLTDIEFDVNGDMLLGIRDRFGDQIGFRNRKPIADDQSEVSAISPGEILRAGKCNPTDNQWTIETDGAVCGSVASVAQLAAAGPGDGKYYWGDRVQNGANHQLSSQGGLALLAGSGKLAMTAVDPIDQFNTGGIKRLHNDTGAKDGNATGTTQNPNAGVVLYSSDAFGYGKANGLGDLEVLCDPAPTQIGNRVWRDTNHNGIQDPNEPALPGVVVRLSGPGVPTNTTAITNGDGEYYFSTGPGTSTTSFVYNLTALTPGASYSLTFPTSVSGLTMSSKPNAGTGTNADAIDTDANSAGVISFVLGDHGLNNFTFDAAFDFCSLVAGPVSASCNPATNRYTLTGTISLTNAPASSLTVSAGGTTTVVSVSAGQASVSYVLSGTSLLSSGPATQTLTITSSASACGFTSATYTAPASCTGCLLAAATTILPVGTVGTAYSQTITTTGEVLPVSYSLVGSLPTGLTLNTSTGVISGTPTAASGSSFTVQVSDARSCSISIPLTLSVTCPALTLTGATLPGIQVNLPFSQTLSASGSTSPYTFTVLNGSLPAGLGLSSTGVLIGLPTVVGSSTFTIQVSDANNCTLIRSLSVTVTAEPVCSLNATASPTICSTVTNTYSVTGTVSAVNASASQTLTVSAGGASTTVVLAGGGPVSYTLANLVSDGQIRTVSITSSASACGATSVTYAAPASCTVCPMLTVTTTSLASGTVGVGFSQSVTTTGGQAPYSYALAAGTLPDGVTLSASGVFSGTPTSSGTSSVTVRVTDSRSCSAAVAATFVVDQAPVCSLSLTVTPGDCNSATNQYAITGTVSATNSTGIQSLTIQEGVASTVVALTGSGPVSFTLGGLTSDGTLQVVSVLSSNTACGTVSQTYTAPQSCSVAPPPVLVLTNSVNRNLGQIGDVLTYTVSVANTGPTTATNVVVSQVLDAGINIIAASIITTTGTFAASLTGGGTWTIPTLPSGTTATLTFSVSVTSEGLFLASASLPDQRVNVCTSVPINVCQGSSYAIQIDAPAGYTRYQWYLTTPSGTTLVSDVTSTSANASIANSYTATRAGEYRVVVDEGVLGSCPDESCCPIIIQETEVPWFTALTRSPTCIGTTPQADGQVSLTALGSNPTVYTYQYSPGNAFNAGTASTVQNVPVNGILSSALAVGTYTIRVYDASGCFRDATVSITSACTCKDDICAPVAIRKTKSLGRVLAP